jgi:two-component system response regulator NreC
VVTEGIRLLLERQGDLRVVATAATLAEATQTGRAPDVVVLDLVEGGERGPDTVATLLTTYPAARILVLTMVDDPQLIQAVLGAGAHGYLLKEAAAADLVEAVRRVAAGEEYLQPAVGVALARAQGVGKAPTPGLLLTDREREVARLLALGHTNAEIAEILGVSRRTVDSHRARLLDRLGVRTRAELVRRATEEGLVDLSQPED